MFEEQDQENEFSKFRKRRGVPDHVEIGSPVIVDGQRGTIFGFNSSDNLSVVFDGSDFRVNCHPSWRTEYPKQEN